MNSLITLGHHVLPVQEDRTSPAELREMILDQPTDMVLYTRTWGLDGPAMLKLWEELREHGIPTVSYHLDLYFGLSRPDLWQRLASKNIKGLADDPFWRTQFCFTVDGDPEACAYFRSLGINHYFLRAGVFHREAWMAEPTGSIVPIIFVGSEGYHKEWPYRPNLIKWLRKTYGSRFQRFGPPHTVRNDELNQVYANSRIVIGDSLNPGFCKPWYTSDRVYETLGRGGFLIHPYIKGMEEEFADGTHLVFYNHGDLQDLKEKIDYWLQPAQDEELEAIRFAGHELVKSRYTYYHRMKQLMQTVFPNG